MFNKYLGLCGVTMSLTLLLCGCGNSTSSGGVTVTEANQGLPIMGDTIKYDPNKLINEGEPISLDFYVWDDAIIKDIATAYEELFPNVNINVVVNPWDDYWTKLPLELSSSKGPALFNVHNSYHDNIIDYMAPYDIPLEDLQADFLAVDSHVIDGEVYYIDYGIMTGAIYYNKEMWQAAGLTENDIPKTWQEFQEIAEKLTIKEGDNLVQSGFNFNGDLAFLLLGLPYQLGQNIFDSSGKTVTIANDSNIQVAQMLVDLYTKYQVGSGDFGTSAEQSFGQEQSAMVYKWAHYNNNLKVNYPDVDYGVFEIPTFTEETPYAYDRYNGESTFGINKNADSKEQEIAQDFIKFFLANDEVQKKLCLDISVFPTKFSLAEDSDIQSHPLMGILKDTIDHYIWPGPMPATVENTLKQVSEDIIYNNVDIKTALEKAEETINADLEQTQFESTESLYKYAK